MKTVAESMLVGMEILEVLSKSGKVRMALQETSWAARFGMLDDQFGMPWMINCNRSL